MVGTRARLSFALILSFLLSAPTSAEVRDATARHQEVVFVEPGKLLRLSGGLGPLQGMGLQGILEWRLAAAGDGTRITKFAPIVDGVQALQLGGLAARLRAGNAAKSAS